jgi:hypothetical protein
MYNVLAFMPKKLSIIHYKLSIISVVLTPQQQPTNERYFFIRQLVI